MIGRQANNMGQNNGPAPLVPTLHTLKSYIYLVDQVDQVDQVDPELYLRVL